MKVATWRGESRFTIDEAPDPARIEVNISTLRQRWPPSWAPAP